MGMTMKVRFIAPEKTRDFKEGQVLEARYPADNNRNIIVIANQWGEHYGYPAKWFEIIEESSVRPETVRDTRDDPA